MTTAPEELELETPFIPITGLAWGPAHGRRMLALHGWLDNAASFAPLAPYLSHWRIAALDLTGHGRSGHRPRGIHYYFVDYVADVVAAADALGWDRFTLLGHSLGGAVGCFLAASFPARVEALILIDALGPLARKPSQEPTSLARAIEQINRVESKQVPLYTDIEEAARVRMTAGDLSFANATLLVERSTRRVDGGITWRSDPKLRVTSPHYVAEDQILAYLRAIRSPTSLIRGTQGHLVNRAHVERRICCVPDFKLIDLPGGHHLHMETPQEVARAMQQALPHAD